MVDKRIVEAARILVEHSTSVKRGDRVVISAGPEAAPLALEVLRLCLEKDAYPTIRASMPLAGYYFLKHAKEHHLKYFPKVAMYEIKNTDVYISIGTDRNTKEFTSIPPEKIALRSKTLDPISKWRVEHTRWVIFDYPTDALAQDADMSLPEYEDFVFGATNIDWASKAKELRRLAGIVNAAKNVRIVGEDTDLSFSIAGSRCIAGDGKYNMPDGEVFTAPRKFSANGHIRFSFPAIYNGKEVEDVYLEFKNGKVIKATAGKNENFLRTMLKLDSGASYLGEFGIGCNYQINKFTKNILFDEKIGGTIHLALGMAYKDCRGENKSALHWDMIKDLRKNGAVYLDGKLFEKNGRIIV